MSTMQALVLQELGQPPELSDHPLPLPAEDEAFVRIEAAALNRRDLWIIAGQYPGIAPPVVLGSDGCGVVEQVNKGDRSWVGQRVLICPSLDWGEDPTVQGPDYSILGNPRDGTFAQAITIPQENLVPCPAHLSGPEAGALPLAGLTAWRGLVTRGGIHFGDRVLITGIGGGVASMALVFTQAIGAETWVSSSSDEKISKAVEYGATGGIRYDQEGWRKKTMAEIGEGFDLIFDGAGGSNFGELVRMLNPAGRIVFYGGTRGSWPAILPQHLFYKQVSILASTMGSPQEFRDMVAFVERYKLRPVVDRVFPLSEASQALARLQSGDQLGKVVIEVQR
jgi:NADPH:quinone reductase-like Zn-dependent oxidoreductase